MCPSLFVLRTPNEELRLPTTVTTSVGEFFFKEIQEPIRGVGRRERELTRSGTITLKPSLENPKKKTGKQKKYRYVNAISLAPGGDLLHPSRHLCLQTYALVQIQFPSFVLLFFSISDYSVMNELMFFVFFSFLLRVKHLLYNGT